MEPVVISRKKKKEAEIDPEQVARFFEVEISSIELKRRLNCIKYFDIIAALLKQDFLKSRVLPSFIRLAEKLDSIEEELVNPLLKLIIDMKNYIPDCTEEVTQLLLKITTLDSLVISKKGLDYLMDYTVDRDIRFVETKLVPHVLNLSLSPTFNTLVTSMLMFPKVYVRSQENKYTLRTKFLDLSRHENPLVRRAVAFNMPALAKVLTSEVMQSELFPCLKLIGDDDWENVRISALEAVVQISFLCTPRQLAGFIVTQFKAFADDKSWRVRQKFAEMLPVLTEPLGQELTEEHLFSSFEKLALDRYETVRTTAFTVLIGSFSKVSGARIEKTIFPIISMIILNPEIELMLRRKIAHFIALMPKTLGRYQTTSLLVPLCNRLLSDPDEVIRYEVVESLINVGKTIGPQILTRQLVITLKLQLGASLSKLRKGVLESFTNLVIMFESFQLVSDFNEVYLTYLTDPAGCVRKYGLESLHKIVKRFGNEWVKDHFMPRLIAAYRGDHKARLTVLMSLKELEFDFEMFKVILMELANDKVDYIRSETRKYIYEHCDEEQTAQVIVPDSEPEP